MPSYDEHSFAGAERPSGRPGGDWAGIRPAVENPMTWSIYLGALGGIAVRVHVLFLLYIVVELLRSVSPTPQGAAAPLGFQLTATLLGILVVLVLAHEFGHCLVCRLMRGTATEVLLWPLGGLAACRPENRWQAHLATALGGPIVNLLFCVLAGGMLWAITGQLWGVGVPNLIDPFATRHDIELNLFGRWELIALYLVNLISWVLLAFNLLPMFPLDGGRILHALLWPRMGYVNAMRLAVRLGLVVAAMLFVYGAIMGSIPAVAVALFGAFISWTTHRQLEFTEATLGYEAGLAEIDETFPPPADDHERGGEVEIDLQHEPEESEYVDGEEDSDEEELDRILKKVGKTGVESLSPEELARLQDATRRRREGQE